MDKFVGGVPRSLDLGHRRLLQMDEVGLGLVHPSLNPAADISHTFAGLVRRQAQQFFCTV